MKTQASIGIVGGGPVGLVLALALQARGVFARVFEKQAEAKDGSRSIGIHPPSLELLADLGLVERFLERGVRVRRGHAFGVDGPLGTVDFRSCPGRFPFILALPQEETERILREALAERMPGALVVAEVAAVVPHPTGVTLRLADGAPYKEETMSVVVGAEGKASLIRKRMGGSFAGAAYPGSYLMADFPDTTRFGDDAAVFLHPEGLVESFPLPKAAGPHRIRRWVVRIVKEERGDLSELIEAVSHRTGHRLLADQVLRSSWFRAERYLAGALAHGRLALAGDAAHVVSPIGGQGMNLGWLGASSLADTLGEIVHHGVRPERALRANAKSRRRVAAAAARRAEVNMWLGRPLPDTSARERFVHRLLASPAQLLLARVFTMRGLSYGV